MIQENKTKKHSTCFYIENDVETPQLFTMKKTALFGMFSLLTILILNVPILVENTYAYGTNSNEESLKTDGESLARNYFNHNVVIQTGYDQNNAVDGSSMLEKRTSMGIEPND